MMDGGGDGGTDRHLAFDHHWREYVAEVNHLGSDKQETTRIESTW